MNHLRDSLAKMVQGLKPSPAQLRLAFDDLLDPDVSPPLAASWLTALRMAGENAETLAAAVDSVMARMVEFGSVEEFGSVRLDTCGTGGDHASSLNISTAAAIVCAAAGVTVLKHGNRSATGKSGSSEVLEKLGIRLDLTVAQLRQAVTDQQFAFLFAPAFHPALKTLAPIRKSLPFRTVFNMVGPLANPARPTHQLLGVADIALADLFAEVLRKQGITKAAIISAQDGLDEVSLGAPTRALIVTKDGFEEHLWHPELTFGLPMYEPGLVRVESPEESARRILAVFSKSPEAPADEAYIVANAAAALWLTGRASSPIAGVSVAREVIESGLALAKLNGYAKYTQSVSG